MRILPLFEWAEGRLVQLKPVFPRLRLRNCKRKKETDIDELPLFKWAKIQESKRLVELALRTSSYVTAYAKKVCEKYSLPHIYIEEIQERMADILLRRICKNLPLLSSFEDAQKLVAKYLASARNILLRVAERAAIMAGFLKRVTKIANGKRLDYCVSLVSPPLDEPLDGDEGRTRGDVYAVFYVTPEDVAEIALARVEILEGGVTC